MSQANTTPDDAELRAQLTRVPTATATALVVERGYPNAFMTGATPLQPGARACGRARTIRFGPMRPDLAVELASRQAHMWLAIESFRPGDLLVVDCGGDLRGGTVGDILAARIKSLGGVGVLIDGAVRDPTQIRELVGLPVWARGVHGSGYPPYLVSLDWDRPVRCFGATVVPGDYVLADDDGAVAIPAPLAADVARLGEETERKEAFIRVLVEQGGSLEEVYPPNAETLRRYEASKGDASG